MYAFWYSIALGRIESGKGIDKGSGIVHYPYGRIHETSGRGFLFSILEGTYQLPIYLVSFQIQQLSSEY